MSVPESVSESGTESANGVLEPVTNKNVPCCKLVTVESMKFLTIFMLSLTLKRWKLFLVKRKSLRLMNKW